MGSKIIFNATESDEFKVYITDLYDIEIVKVEIPLGVEFDYSQYAPDPEQPWLPATNRFLVMPNDGATILNVDTDSSYVRPNQEGNYFWWVLGDKGNYSVDVIAIANSPDVVAPYNRVYKVDSATIGEFSNIVAQAPGDNINYTDYVIQLLSIPFEIPSEFVSVEAPITLGPLVTNVNAPTLSTDLMRISLGDIVVGGLYGNSLDYYAAQYTLVLPYVAMEINLDPHCVVGETVSVQYVLDAYTGDVTVNVFSTSQDDPIHTSKTSVGRTIPFKTYGNTTEGTVGAIQGADNGVVAAYIRADRKVTASGQFSNMVTVERDLEGLEGFVSVENLDIQCGATYDELQAITDRLRGGVIIK